MLPVSRSALAGGNNLSNTNGDMPSTLKVGDSVLFTARKSHGKRFEAKGKILEMFSMTFKGKKQKRARIEVARGGKYHKLMGKRVTSVALHNLKSV